MSFRKGCNSMRMIWAAEGGASIEEINAGTHKFLGHKNNQITQRYYTDPSFVAVFVMNRQMKEGASPSVASDHLRDIMSHYTVGKNLPTKMAIADMAKDWSSHVCKVHENLYLGKQIFTTTHTTELPDVVKDLNTALLPMRVCKEFEVDGVKEAFFGEIVSVEEVEDDDGEIAMQLQVRYDDGDEEDLKLEEVQEARDAYITRFSRSSCQFSDAVTRAYAHHCTTSKGKPGTKKACDEWMLAAAVFYSNDEQEHEKVNAKRAREKKLLQLDRLAHLYLITLLHECETQKAYKDTFWAFIKQGNKICGDKVSVARTLLLFCRCLASSSYHSAAVSLPSYNRVLPQARIEQFQFPENPPKWLDFPALKKHAYFPISGAALPQRVVDYVKSDRVESFINERNKACKDAREAAAKKNGNKVTQMKYSTEETATMNRWYKESGCERGVKYFKALLIAKFILAKDGIDGDNALNDRDVYQVHRKITFLQEPLPQATSSSSTTTTTKTASSSESETSGSSDVNQR